MSEAAGVRQTNTTRRHINVMTCPTDQHHTTTCQTEDQRPHRTRGHNEDQCAYTRMQEDHLQKMCVKMLLARSPRPCRRRNWGAKKRETISIVRPVRELSLRFESHALCERQPVLVEGAHIPGNDKMSKAMLPCAHVVFAYIGV